jgi:hypothetical protein
VRCRVPDVRRHRALSQEQPSREAYNDTDVKVTYILLCCTAALEYLSAGLKSYLECFLKVTGLPQADQVAQYSIIAHLASSNKLTVLAFHLGFLDRFCCMLPAPVESSDAITRLVHDHITSGWVET